MEELIEALKTIKKVCEMHESCDFCPMADYGGSCHLMDKPPADWKLAEQPKVFKYGK